jgi:hypothetical protein
MKFFNICLLLFICVGCSGDDNETAMDTPVEVDMGMNAGDMMVEVDAEVILSQLTAAPAALSIPITMGSQPVQVNFEITASGAPVNVSSVVLDLPGTTSRLLYKRTFQTGIDYDGSDRFAYPVQIVPEMPMPMMLEVAAQEVESVSGTLTITGDFEGETLEIPITQGGAGPQLTLGDMAVDFGRVAENNMKTETIIVSNSGGSTLTVQNILLRSFGVDFSVLLNGEDAIENPSAYADPDGDGEQGLSPGGSFEISVTYAPMSEGTDEATLVLRSDDALNPEQEVTLVANTSYSCMDVTPEMMRCDGVLQELTVCETLIVVSNCHDTEALIVDRVHMNASTDAFFIDDDSLPAFPHAIELNQTLEIEIRYLPGVARSNHRGNLLIHGNDLETPNRNIQITGVTPCASTEECPMEYACIENECVFQEPPEEPMQ